MGPSGSAEIEVNRMRSPVYGACGAYVKTACGDRFWTGNLLVSVHHRVPSVTHSLIQYQPASANDR